MVAMNERAWEVELSTEVADWYITLKTEDRARARRSIELLKVRGPQLSMPHSRTLGEGLRELRFDCENVARRITYYWDENRRAITLTTFRKQRQSEQREVKRAVKAMRQHKEG
jgi:hypothetical protein